jgi:hypothetical protein
MIMALSAAKRHDHETGRPAELAKPKALAR